jgi:hypothetical protein
VGSIGQANGALSLGSSLQEESSGEQLSLVYVAVTPSGSCPAYQGVSEGTSLAISLFDYGTAPFTPVEFVVNSTVYGGSYPDISPGTMSQYSIVLGSCTRSSGLSVAALDSRGDLVQFA